MNIQANPMMNAYQGIQNGFQQLTENSAKIASPQQTDKAEPLINHKRDAQQIEASAKAIKTYDQMIGTIIDVMA
ncbi:MAG: hypothetical protein RBS36_12070 [Thiomicrospira sp.]|jgi:hypothetical protein|nr:hypothetical protein [Thiomicrospira sp.]